MCHYYMYEDWLMSRLIIFYKGLYNLITLEMPSYITSTTTTPYSTRFQHPFHFNILKARTNFYHNSYFPETVRDWNSLPISAIEAHTVNSFCNQLSLFLLLIIIVMYVTVICVIYILGIPAVLTA